MVVKCFEYLLKSLSNSDVSQISDELICEVFECLWLVRLVSSGFILSVNILNDFDDASKPIRMDQSRSTFCEFFIYF